MHRALEANHYFLRDHANPLRSTDAIEVLDASSGGALFAFREPRPPGLSKLFRGLDWRGATPFAFEATTPEGERVLTVRRGIAVLPAPIEVFDERGERAGTLQQKTVSLGGRIEVLDTSGTPLTAFQGKFDKTDYRCFSPDKDHAVVTKKWAGVGRELIQRDGDYLVAFKDTVGPEDPLRILVLAAVIVIDALFKD